MSARIRKPLSLVLPAAALCLSAAITFGLLSAQAQTSGTVQRVTTTGAKATTSGGVTVRLLGVSHETASGPAWWLPNGVPLPRSPAREGNRAGTSNPAGKNEQQVEFSVKMTARTPEPLDWEYDVLAADGTSLRAGGAASSSAKMNGDTEEVLARLLPSLSDTSKPATLRLRIASGPWKTVLETRADGGEKSLGAGSVHVGPAEETPRSVVVTVANTLHDTDCRLILVAANGKETQATDKSSERAHGTLQTKYRFPLSYRKEISRMRFQIRPYETVAFHDVHLRPLNERQATGVPTP